MGNVSIYDLPRFVNEARHNDAVRRYGGWSDTAPLEAEIPLPTSASAASIASQELGREVERPDNTTLSGRLKIILGIATSLADSMDDRGGTQCGDVLREYLKDSGFIGLLKTEISFQTSASAAPAVRQDRDRAVEQSDNATLSGRLKEILGIVTSLPDSLDVSRGTYCGDGLRDILQESGILDPSLSDRPGKPASNFAPPPTPPAPRQGATSVQACSLLEDTKSRRAAQSAADRTRSQAAAAQLVKDKADAAALVKGNRKLQQERDLARAKVVRLEEDAAAAAALVDDAALRDEVRELRAQLDDLFLENDDIRGRLSDLENDEGSEEAAVEESADVSAVDCSLREEVREVRAQLNDLFLENDDIRDRLNDLENGAGTEDAEVEEEKSADDSADDYFRDPGEELVAAVDCSLREEVRELRAQLADLFLENDDIRDRLNDLENDEDTEDAEEEEAAEKSADDYYRDPGEDLDAADREMEMARAAADAGRLAAFTLRPHPHYADASPASAYAAEYVLGSLATGAPYHWYARTCLFCPHDKLLLANFLGSGRTARLTNDLLRFDLDTLMAELRTRPLPPLVSGLAAN
jgi:regulator of replication initiation timing